MKRLPISAIAIAAILMIVFLLALQLSAGGKKASITDRLQQLEDREEIRQLIMDYGKFLDQRDFASFSELFAEKDGEWIGGLGQAKSRTSIRNLMESTLGGNKAGGQSGPNCHLFTNEVIQVNANQAAAKTKWIFVVQNSSRQPQPVYIGHYEDTFIKEGGRWKFLRRIAYGDIPPDDLKESSKSDGARG